MVRRSWGIHCGELIPSSAQEFHGTLFGELPTRNHPTALQMESFRIVDQFGNVSKNCGEAFLGNSLRGTDPKRCTGVPRHHFCLRSPRNHPTALQMDSFRIVDQFEHVRNNCGEAFLGNSLRGTDPMRCTRVPRHHLCLLSPRNHPTTLHMDSF